MVVWMTETPTDFDAYAPIPEMPVFESLKVVQDRFGVSPFEQISDIVRIGILKKRFRPEEYYKTAVFAVPSGERETFLGSSKSHSVNHGVNVEGVATSYSTVNNKTLHGLLLAAAGLATPKLQALVHPTQYLNEDRVLRTADDLETFLRTHATYPLFGKPVNGSLSLGVFSFDRFDPETDELVASSGARAPVARVVQDIFQAYGHDGYLLQDRVKVDPALAEFCGSAVGCVRMVTLREGGKASPLYAVWKIPRRDSVADNLWRSGNMIAHLDLATGKILRVQKGAGVLAEELEDHPEAGRRLIGWRMPHWDALKQLAVRAADLTPDLAILGWDIAVSVDGPVIIEGNTGPDHSLYQNAARQGLMKGEVGERLQQAMSAAIETTKAVAASQAQSKKRDRERFAQFMRQSADFGSLTNSAKRNDSGSE